MSKIRIGFIVALAIIGSSAFAQVDKTFDAAAAFGARPSVSDISLSPDGSRAAYVTPTSGQGSAIYTIGFAKGDLPKLVVAANGKPDRLGGCFWVSNDRLVCTAYGVVLDPIRDPVEYTRVFAINTDGSNFKLLSRRDSPYGHGMQLWGGEVLDYLPDEDGAVLMSRVYVRDDHTGSRIGSSTEGLGVDWVDTRTLAVKHVEPAHLNAVDYISDGRGHIRIMGIRSTVGAVGGYRSSIVDYLYRTKDSQDWQKLSTFDWDDHSGFRPVAVDHDLNVAYGYKKLDGRMAVYSVALDGSLEEKVVFARPDVDVTGVLKIGRRQRVVGAVFLTDYAQKVFFDPQIGKLSEALAKALPDHPLLGVTDSDLEENKLLIRAGSDHDPGVYYLFDRKLHQLQTFLVVSDQLEGVKLATVTPISYPAADGTMIPGYLTLPPGMESPKGLPAIVMPHGGPGSRDFWRFDWLAQFYAARGYAVLQPNFRASAGYGDAWLEKKGFQSWKSAIGDVVDAGRWLVSQNIADPSKLAIVGWSYGGYAALQSAVVAPDLFKAVVAIAPVTDFAALKESRRYWSDFEVVSREIGDGPHIHEGSPADNADKIKAPVLMFQGVLDRNVPIQQSREMDARLKKAGVPHELVTFDDLDHQLEDSAVRTEMLRKSDAFLRKAFDSSAASLSSNASK
jgi:dienelactone hydrolase